MKKFTFYKKDGQKIIVEAQDLVEALAIAGYPVEDIRELPFFFFGENQDFIWIEKDNRWSFNHIDEFGKSGQDT